MSDARPRSVMVVGGGSPRDHALVRAMRRSPRVGRVVFVPGNSAIEALEGVESAPVATQDTAGLVELAEMEEFDLTVVGPNTPLVSGIVDAFRARDLPIFGSAGAAARLEGSKVFAKNYMLDRDIPTARFAVFQDTERASHFCRSTRWARVVKTDGLAYEKGVQVCHSVAECEEAIQRIMVDEVLDPDQPAKVLLEERLEGPEVTLCALSDGKDVLTLDVSLNYPRLLDGDAGPRTRGMGAVSPAPQVSPELMAALEAKIVRPAVERLVEIGPPLVGALFIDVILQRGRPYVLDFNVRFGDPATQVLLARLRSDLFELMEACVEGRLAEYHAESLRLDPRPAVTVVVAAEGYPLRRRRDDPVTLDPLLGEGGERGDLVLDIGELRQGPTGLLSTGGRVASVTALGADRAEATRRAYEGVRGIRFDGAHFRHDIGTGDPYLGGGA